MSSVRLASASPRSWSRAPGAWQSPVMDFAAVVRSRRMVRSYQPGRAVSDAVLDRVLQNAVHAPSAGFSQGWDFVVLRRPEDLERFWEVTTDPQEEPDEWLQGMRTAPVLVVCLSDRERYLTRYAEPDKGWTDRDEARWPVPYWDVDTGMAALLMLLTAVDLGLGSCFFGVPPARHGDLRQAFGIPANRTPVGVVSVGYAASDRRSPSLKRGRRGLDVVAHEGRFGPPPQPVEWVPRGPGRAPGPGSAMMGRMARRTPPTPPEDFTERIVDIDVE